MKYNDQSVRNRIEREVNSLILERGVKGWNMDLLAERAGLAKNTLYRIVGSKEDIVGEAVLGYIRSIQKQLVAVIDEERPYFDSLEKLVSLFPDLLDLFYTSRMREIFLEYPGIEEAVARHKDELTGVIISFFGKGKDAGLLRADLDAEVLFELLQAIVMQFNRRGPDAVARQLRIVFGYIVDGVRKR